MKFSLSPSRFVKAIAVFTLPVCLFAEPKNLAIDDVDFTSIQTPTRGGSTDSVRVKILWQRDQFRSIQNKDLSIEARFYSGSNRSQAKRIMKEDTYLLRNRSSSYDLKPSEACPRPGKYWAKVWLSVRNNDAKLSRNESYKDYEEYYSYTCVDRNRMQAVHATTDFKLADPINRYNYKQLNLLVDLDNQQYERVSREGDKFEVRLYTERDGQNYRVGKGRTYIVPNASRSSFTFKIKELCGEMDGFLDFIFGKEVEVGCRITVVDADGSRNPDYDEYRCATERFMCYN